MSDQPQNDYQRGKQEAEQEIIKALRAIHPLAVTITPAPNGGYRWEWYEGAGTAPDFATAVKHALDYAMTTLLSMDPQRSTPNYTPADQVSPSFGRPDWFYHPTGNEE